MFFLLISLPVFAQQPVTVGENFRIYPSNVTQTEVFIARHPLNNQVLFSSANTITFAPFFVSEGVYVSTNGGESWFGSDTCAGAPIAFHGGDPGIAINKNGTFILTRLGQDFFPGVYAHYSNDFGQSWSNAIALTTDDIERAALVTDAAPASPYSGRTYAVFAKLISPFATYISYTDDGAVWSAPQQINAPSMRNAGADVSVGSDGTVYVCWAGVANASPFQESLTGFARSTNGGQSWTVQETAFEMSGIQGQLSQKSNIRVNGMPRIEVDNSGGPRDGWIYIVTTQYNRPPAGSDPDIILHRSTNGGQSWSPGIRVNRDALNNDKIQYFPALHVDDWGGLNIIFYDDRNTSSDSTGVYLARSADGGASWLEAEISDHHFRPVPIGGLGQGYQGDNIDLTSSGNRLLPMWMDNVSGIYQIWSAPVEFSPVGLLPLPGDGVIESFDLQQNFPNPFNPQTTIRYRLPQTSSVTLQVFDIAGRLVKILADQLQAAGNYEIMWDGTDNSGKDVASGIYFCRLNAGNFQQTRRMLLVR